MSSATLAVHPEPLLGLSVVERVVVQMLSVLYVPTPISGIATVLDGFASTEWNTEKLRPVLESLHQRNLIEVKNGRFSCLPSTVEPITRGAAQTGILPAMAARLSSPLKPRYAVGTVRGKSLADRAASKVYAHCDEVMRDLRLAVYLHDSERFLEILNNHWDAWLHKCKVHPFRQI